MRDKNTFKSFLIHNKRNQIIFLIVGALIILQFAIFKYFYPFASYIHGDSFVYLQTAYSNLDINTYMVGYSRFLRIFSVFTKSDTALVTFQYLMLQSSVLYFLFTIFYFYKTSKAVQVTLLGFMVLNPLFWYMANYVSSDAFFLALSFTWFTLLLWIIHRPTIQLIIWHTLVVFVAFTVRYNALIYPFIAALAFLLSRQPIRMKLAGFIAGVLVVGLFIVYTGNKYKELTGTWQYSPFSGWQMANNAMYAYRYVDSAKRKPVLAKFRGLDNMVRTYFDTTRNPRKHPEETLMASTLYMWDVDNSPLYKYRNLQFRKDTTASELKKWASIAPFYGDYGSYIIKQYPIQFAKHFLWPNANKYYSPPVEFLEYYNMGRDSVTEIASTWFGYKSHKVMTRFKDFHVGVLNYYPILSGIMNVLFLFGFICFIMLNGFSQSLLFQKALLLAGTVWLINAGFTIFASSAALRFQAFPVLLMCVFAVLLVEFVCRAAFLNQEAEAENKRVEKAIRNYAKLNRPI
jgi:hypothetical protein